METRMHGVMTDGTRWDILPGKITEVQRYPQTRERTRYIMRFQLEDNCVTINGAEYRFCQLDYNDTVRFNVLDEVLKLTGKERMPRNVWSSMEFMEGMETKIAVTVGDKIFESPEPVGRYYNELEKGKTGWVKVTWMLPCQVSGKQLFIERWEEVSRK